MRALWAFTDAKRGIGKPVWRPFFHAVAAAELAGGAPAKAIGLRKSKVRQRPAHIFRW